MEIDGLERHSITLNKKTGRRVIVFGPAEMKKAELKRLQEWLAVQFIIEDEEGEKI